MAATVNLNNSSPTLTARRSSIYVASIFDLVRLSRDVGDRYRPQLRSDLARGWTRRPQAGRHDPDSVLHRLAGAG